MPLSEGQINSYVEQSGLPDDEKERLRELLKNGALNGFTKAQQPTVKRIIDRAFADGVEYALGEVEKVAQGQRHGFTFDSIRAKAKLEHREDPDDGKSIGTRVQEEEEANDGSWITGAERQLPEGSVVDAYVPHVRKAIDYLTGGGSSNDRMSMQMAVNLLREIVPPLPLPSVTHTLIRVHWKSTRRSAIWRLDESGLWANETGHSSTASDLYKDINHWDYLARPV